MSPIADNDTNWPTIVREQCQQILHQYPAEQLNTASMDAWLSELNTVPSLVSLEPPPLPLKFDTLEDELTVCALLERLDEVLSVDDALLRQTCQRSAHEVILFGVLSLHISEHALDARRLANISLAEVSSYFSLPLQREVPHPTIPIARIGERAETRDCAERVQRVLNALGRQTQRAGQTRLGAVVRQAAEQARDQGHTAVVFASKLVQLLPAFDDIVKIDGRDVLLRSAAQRLAQHLQHRFGDEYDGLFRFTPAVSTACRLHRLAQAFVERGWLQPTSTIQRGDTTVPLLGDKEYAVVLALIERAVQQTSHLSAPIYLEALLLA
jgi:hypothetical protein